MTDALRYRDPPESGIAPLGCAGTCARCGARGPVWRDFEVSAEPLPDLCSDDEAKRLAVEALIR